jgi:hypothetical protein
VSAYGRWNSRRTPHAEHRHPGELGRRRRAVGVDERDQVGVAARERLHEHAALPQLRELVEDDAVVVERM